MIVMLRAMAPDIMITDEIGSAGDVLAILEMARSGVTFIGTLHANSIEDLKARTTLSPLFQDKTIERLIFIERIHRQTVVKKVYDRQLRLIVPG
jgi:stage III sporulation protein AA